MTSRDKNKVYQAYDEIADWFDEHRERGLIEKKYLELVIKSIPKGSSILDLGCGMGELIAQYLIESGYEVTGIDASQKMIALCKQRFPQQQWRVADMREINLTQRFEVIIAWHSFFHLPHDGQRAMFNLFAQHIKPGGILIFTSGTEHSEVWSNNGGQELYHASLATEEYAALLKKVSFEVVMHV